LYDLPQTTINKAIDKFSERLNAGVAGGGGHFAHNDVNIDQPLLFLNLQ